jgi:hypothetical protein
MKMWLWWVWRSLRLAVAWSLESGVWFCLGAFGTNLFSCRDTFSLLIYLKECFIIFNAICKYSTAINFITAHHEK